jgi:hypothetical protein
MTVNAASDKDGKPLANASNMTAMVLAWPAWTNEDPLLYTPDGEKTTGRRVQITKTNGHISYVCFVLYGKKHPHGAEWPEPLLDSFREYFMAQETETIAGAGPPVQCGCVECPCAHDLRHRPY